MRTPTSARVRTAIEVLKKLEERIANHATFNMHDAVAGIARRRRRSGAHRSAKWLTRKWKVSRKGHPWIKAGDYHIVVCAEGRAGQYRLFINEKRGQRLYPSELAAKLAAFDAIKKMKERGKL